MRRIVTIVILGIFALSGLWFGILLLWRDVPPLSAQSYRRLTTPSPNMPREPSRTLSPHMARARIQIGRAELTVEVARDSEAWTRGLSGRVTLPMNDGMIFIFPSASERTFWMKDTKIPLDILWIREGTVVGIEENVQPGAGFSPSQLPLFRSPGPVNAVVEVNAGWARNMGITVGERISRIP